MGLLSFFMFHPVALIFCSVKIINVDAMYEG